MTQTTERQNDDVITTRPGERLSLGTKAAYGLGDFASQLMWSLGSSYLVLFYTDNVGLAAGSVAVMMLITRVIDAITDPIVGALAERHATRFGRFRPWILFGSPFLALATALTFTTIPGGETAKLLWAWATYILLGLLYTAVNLPYGALSTVMTRDQGERTALTSFRMIGTNLGSVTLSALTMPLVLYFSGAGDGQTTTVTGYTITAAILALIGLPLFVLVFVKCKEVIQPDLTHTRVPLRESLKAVLGNKPLMLVTLALFLSLGNLFGRLGVAVYYYIYLMGRYDLIAPLMMLPSIAGAIGIALFTRMSKRIGKKRTVILSLVLVASSTIALFFVDPHNTQMVVALTALYGLCNFAVPVLMSMVPDSIDYAEDQTGIRSDGIAYAATSMGTKIASAVGGALGIAIMGYFGFIANAEQTATAAMGINFSVNIVPAVFSLLAIIPVALYPITEARYREIRASLDAKEAPQPPFGN